MDRASITLFIRKTIQTTLDLTSVLHCCEKFNYIVLTSGMSWYLEYSNDPFSFQCDFGLSESISNCTSSIIVVVSYPVKFNMDMTSSYTKGDNFTSAPHLGQLASLHMSTP